MKKKGQRPTLKLKLTIDEIEIIMRTLQNAVNQKPEIDPNTIKVELWRDENRKIAMSIKGEPMI